MKFTKLVALIAITTWAAQTLADGDGTLRRQVAQNDLEQSTTTSTTKEVNININTQPTAAQPTTNVEAQPATESKAEALRQQRQRAEIQTEQKIVEKLEDSRLQEEKARADRLFGNKLDPQQPPQQQQPAAAAVVVPPPAAAAPTPPPPAQEKAAQPTQVTIEKVEIVEPAPIKEQKTEVQPIAESKAETSKDDSDQAKQKYYVGALAGDLNYNAANVKSNYALGAAVGTIIDQRWGIELSYMYSNHDIADLWQYQVFHTLAQSDISGKAKYYLLTGKLKPFVGGSLTWINRQYTDRYAGGYTYNYNSTTSESTNAVDMGVLGGLDFAVTDNVLLGAGLEYNFNVMTTNDINYASYNLPAGSQNLEKMSYWTFLVTAKFLF